MIDWSKVKWFKPSEFGQYANQMDPLLIYSLDALRDFVKRPIRINSAFRPGDPGQHGLGKAADIVIAGLGCVDAFLVAEKTRLFSGIGIYPYWHLPGIHVDVRDLRPSEQGARWARNKDNVYVTLDWAFIRNI
jgi:uncharacterized protein YcbK (DUF882 family)